MNEPGKPRVGLLPLMLELYRQYSPEMADRQEPFITRVAEKLADDTDVVRARVCATRREVYREIRAFESKDVDAVVVLFVAYAASISALGPLLETNLPIILFSTAPRSSMAEGMTMDDIMLNHGVHGYMDLANVLKRNARSFQFVAGRVDDARAYAEIGGWARGARVRSVLRSATLGLCGYTFDGMGDFGVDTTYLNATLGPEVRHVPLDLLADRIQAVKEQDVKREVAEDFQSFDVDPGVDDEIHRESNRVYLGLKQVVEELSLNGFTMHFQGVLENPAIRTPPFLAISKLQRMGLAYAGEGDLLGATANLMVRCLLGDTVFTETFCPDFDGGRIVMGHMGESNPAFGERTVLRRKKFVFGETLDPIVADVHMKRGPATVVNLGIVERAEFQMICYTADVCERIPGSTAIDMPYFHLKPDMKLEDLLTRYGMLGGTHHVAMTPGDRTEDLARLTKILGMRVEILS